MIRLVTAVVIACALGTGSTPAQGTSCSTQVMSKGGKALQVVPGPRQSSDVANRSRAERTGNLCSVQPKAPRSISASGMLCKPRRPRYPRTPVYDDMANAFDYAIFREVERNHSQREKGS